MVAELNGALWGQKVAQFRVLPYSPVKRLRCRGKLLNWLAVAPETLQKLLDAEEPEDGAPGEVVDLSMDNIEPVPGDDPDASAESDTNRIRNNYGRAG